MNSYQTFTKVGGEGEIHLVGVPFTPGTEVEIVVSLKSPNTGHSPEIQDRLRSLFDALNLARNTEPIGALNREELYDRNNLH